MSVQRSLFCLFAYQCLIFGLACSDSNDTRVTSTTKPAARQSNDPTRTPDPETATPDPSIEPAAETLEGPAPEPTTPDEVSTTDEPAEGDGDTGLENLSRQDLIKTVSSGVVLITIYDARGEEQGFGSGSVVGDDLILTNHHVVSSAATAKVQLNTDDEEADADELPVTGYLQVDEMNDLALLHVEGLPDDLYRFEIAGPGEREQFEEVFAIGHPDGLKFSVTRGFVNATMPVSELPEMLQYSMPGEETQLIQSDTLISPGSSGGPLMSLRGELVGINTLQLPQMKFAFSVDASHVRDLMEAAASAEVASLPVPGADVLVTPAAASLWFDFYREWLQLNQDMRGAQTPEQMQEIARTNNPAPACAQECLDLVRNLPSRIEGIDALKLGADVVRATREQMGDGSRFYLDRAFEIAAANPELTAADRRLVDSLVGLKYSRPFEDYIRAVLEDSQDEQVRAAAYLALAYSYLGEAGTEFNADREEVVAALADEYGTVLVRGTPIQEYLDAYLSRPGAVGSMAQEIVGTDHEGVEFRLSDYRGKVVVLDFWADWCPHCRVMYEHERNLVERLKDEPFALLGVNADEPARARRVMESGQITWRSWMDGQGGPINEQWNVQALPTVYVLDQEGRIRFEGVRGEDLDAAVESLLFDTDLQLADDLIAADAEWKYAPVTSGDGYPGWNTLDFDDAGWSSGSGTIGYGALDLDTTIDVGTPGERPVTLLFRHRFDVSGGSLQERHYLNLRFNDGVAVYVNGEEVYRDNLAADAGPAATAILRATGRETDTGFCVPLDAGLLVGGSNVIAVELHQISAYSADALLSLTLGSNLPDLSPDANEKSAQRFKVCRLIGQVADGSAPFRAALRSYTDDEAVDVRIAAVTAAALLDERVKYVGLDEDGAQEHLYQAVYYLNEDAWRVAKTPGLAEQQYRAAARRAEAALTLRSELPDEYRESMQGVTNTLGVALFRAGDLEAAIARLEQSLEEVDENPVDLAFLALAHRAAGQPDEAGQRRDEFLELMDTPEWKHYWPGLEIASELEEAFDQAEPLADPR